MGDHPDVEILKRGHQAFNDRDYETLKDCFAEDVKWHTPGSGPMAGTIEGRDELMQNLFEPAKDAPLRVETHDVLANDEHLVGISTLHIGSGGEKESFRSVEVCHTRDGKISERWGLVEGEAKLEEVFARMMGG